MTAMARCCAGISTVLARMSLWRWWRSAAATAVISIRTASALLRPSLMTVAPIAQTEISQLWIHGLGLKKSAKGATPPRNQIKSQEDLSKLKV